MSARGAQLPTPTSSAGSSAPRSPSGARSRRVPEPQDRASPRGGGPDAPESPEATASLAAPRSMLLPPMQRYRYMLPHFFHRSVINFSRRLSSPLLVTQEVLSRCTYEPLGGWFRGSMFINAPRNWPYCSNTNGEMTQVGGCIRTSCHAPPPAAAGAAYPRLLARFPPPLANYSRVWLRSRLLPARVVAFSWLLPACFILLTPVGSFLLLAVPRAFACLCCRSDRSMPSATGSPCSSTRATSTASLARTTSRSAARSVRP